MAKKRPQARRPILIKDEKHGLPYSKGLMASSIMATGLMPYEAYEVAKKIEDHLRLSRKSTVSVKELRRITLQTLRNSFGEQYAEKFRQWQSLSKLDKPLILLMGGTTGVGKSTVAGEIAHRLGINRFISTDAIREVMRAIFSQELMPALYKSSFDAWEDLRVPVAENGDPVVVGFSEQTAAVSVGVRAMIERSIKESTNQIIEGVHLVPGFVDFSEFQDDALIIPIIITVADEDLHRSHFYIRELETEGTRPFQRYRANFDNIRKIGNFIVKRAEERGVLVFDSQNLDATVTIVLEQIITVIADHVAKPTTENAVTELIGEER